MFQRSWLIDLPTPGMTWRAGAVPLTSEYRRSGATSSPPGSAPAPGASSGKGRPDPAITAPPSYIARMSPSSACPFCTPAADAVLAESAHALAILDAYPIAAGHTLVIPRRHVASLFALPSEEWDDLWRLVRRVQRERGPFRDADGVTVGLNDGSAAGQTVPHAHVHVIPRRTGDVPDPRGGVRWVIPERADYWSAGPRSDAE